MATARTKGFCRQQLSWQFAGSVAVLSSRNASGATRNQKPQAEFGKMQLD